MFTIASSQSRERSAIKRVKVPEPKVEDEEIVVPYLCQPSTSSITAEFIKFLLFQRMQLPAPFDQLASWFSDQTSSSSNVIRKTPPNPTQRSRRKFIESFQSMFDLLPQLFSHDTPLEVLVTFGPTVMAAREIYSLRLAVSDSDPSSSDTFGTSTFPQVTRHFLRQLISCSASALSENLPFSNIHIMLAFARDSIILQQQPELVASDSISSALSPLPSSESESDSDSHGHHDALSLHQLFCSHFIPQPRYNNLMFWSIKLLVGFVSDILIVTTNYSDRFELKYRKSFRHLVRFTVGDPQSLPSLLASPPPSSLKSASTLSSCVASSSSASTESNSDSGILDHQRCEESDSVLLVESPPSVRMADGKDNGERSPQEGESHTDEKNFEEDDLDVEMVRTAGQNCSIALRNDWYW